MRLYGTKARTLLGNAKSAEDLGIHFGADLTEAEVKYLMAHEWAMEADDILWRRTKQGLLLTGKERQALAKWLADNREAPPVSQAAQ